MIKVIYVLFVYLMLVPSGYVIGSTSYHVGNSLSWDMEPPGLATMATLAGKNYQNGYHIRFGMPLDYIWNNPDDSEVITNTFGNFVNALSSFEWDFVTIQPSYGTGSTLGQDQVAIGNFIDLTLAGSSTSPIFYIYSAWPSLPDDYQAYWDQPIQNVPNQPTIHARDYFYHLHQNLLDMYGTSVQLYMIPIGEVFYRLDQEFKKGNVPGYEDAGDLYRDTAHLTQDIGSFVAATTVYSTIFKENPVGIERPDGFYLDDSGATNLTEDLRNFIQSIVWEVVSSHPLSGIAPDNFTLGYILGSRLCTLYYSRKISVLGISKASVISITGGEYSINGGEFQNNESTVSANDIVTVRLLSSCNYSTNVTATLTIGGKSDSFRVTTIYRPEHAGGTSLVTIVVLLIYGLFNYVYRINKVRI